MRALVWLGLLLAAPPQEKPRPTVLRHAKIYTLSGAPLEDATLVIEGDRIAAVGRDVAVPPDAHVLDLAGKVVIPGLVDAASRLMVDGGERSPGSAEQNVLDALDLFHEGPAEALRYGVTAVYLNPASTGPVNGLGAVVRLTADRAPLVREAALRLSLASPPGDVSSPAQRYEVYQQIRQAFEGARQYEKSREKYKKDLAEFETRKKAEPEKKKEPPKPGATPPAPPPAEPQKVRVDPRQEILLRALSGSLRVRIEAHSADAIELALKLAEEYKIALVVENATEGAAVVGALVRAKVTVVAGPIFRYGLPSVDYLRHSSETPAILAKAGIPLALASFGDEKAGHWGGGASRFLLEAAAFACSRGLKRDQALAAVTIQAAKALGVEKSLGSLEKGKLADLAILSGEPFDPETVVERTILGGATVYSRPRE